MYKVIVMDEHSAPNVVAELVDKYVANMVFAHYAANHEWVLLNKRLVGIWVSVNSTPAVMKGE
jgi:hypothetical protein